MENKHKCPTCGCIIHTVATQSSRIVFGCYECGTITTIERECDTTFENPTKQWVYNGEEE